jgi:hypothetical protein
MGTGPDPEIPAVLGQLIVQEHGREKRERARHRLAGLVAVEVGPAGSVVERRDVECDLDLLERKVDPGVPHEVSGELHDASGSIEHLEESRRIGRAPPVEVVTDMAGGRRCFRNQSVDFGIQRLQVAGGDYVRKNEIALLGEVPDLLVVEERHAGGRL